MMKALLIILLCMGFGCHIMAQDATKYTDKVILKDGSKLYGSIVSWDVTNLLVLRLQNGGECKIPSNTIKKVEQAEIDGMKKIGGFSLQPKKIYGSISAAALVGRSPWGESSLGGALHANARYAIHRLWAVGLGAGAELYLPDQTIEIHSYPTYATVLWQPAKRLGIQGSVGYAWVGRGQNADYSKTYTGASGGRYVAIQLQYAFNTHLFLFAGVQSSAKKREWTQVWDERNHGYDRYQHNRMALGLTYTL
ncbi:MAG TPA: hypothetical protein PLQ57_15370 [Saprospiraceae bacterium]|nr:hypothetical protein [Saprospiraceae bacterium]HRG66034.1 hypothetical protein [Saprospiraceae bacterium]